MDLKFRSSADQVMVGHGILNIRIPTVGLITSWLFLIGRVGDTEMSDKMLMSWEGHKNITLCPCAGPCAAVALIERVLDSGKVLYVISKWVSGEFGTTECSCEWWGRDAIIGVVGQLRFEGYSGNWKREPHPLQSRRIEYG